MTQAQKSRLFERLQDDTHAVFGERIPMKLLCSVLWFNTEDALKRAVKGRLPLSVRCDLLNGERYVPCDELIDLIVAQYSKAAKRDDD